MIFNELIQDQGESAFILEIDEQGGKFIGYTQPKKGRRFEEGELRNAYLAQTMTDKKFEDQERELLTKYLENNSWTKSENHQELEKSTEVENCRSVYKYKPVAQKIKLVIQELPSKFRIIREIK